MKRQREFFALSQLLLALAYCWGFILALQIIIALLLLIIYTKSGPLSAHEERDATSNTPTHVSFNENTSPDNARKNRGVTRCIQLQDTVQDARSTIETGSSHFATKLNPLSHPKDIYLSNRVNRYLDIFLLSLSISSLISDAIFHLIPEAYGNASHNSQNISLNHSLQLGIGGIIGIFIVFFFERIVHLFNPQHLFAAPHVPHKMHDEHTTQCCKELAVLPRTKCTSSVDEHKRTFSRTKKAGQSLTFTPPSSGCEHHGVHTCHTLISELFTSPKCHFSVDPSETFDSLDTQCIAALTTICSSAMHNIGDGFSIAIALQSNRNSHTGIATCITLFFHEVSSQLVNAILLTRAGFTGFSTLMLCFLVNLFFFVGIFLFFFGFYNYIAFTLQMASATNFLTQALCILLPELQKCLTQSLSMPSMGHCLSNNQYDDLKEVLMCLSGFVLGTSIIVGLRLCE